ncbi:uncharacterized protein [Dermacentor andersoni]|uniref:uncharacterized protein isoform X1 n=1 Tax=Dermacentor andersoni TaxID=34620 RepID=UPI003B3B6B96
MTGLAIIAAAMTAAVLNSVHCASMAKGPEFAGGEQAAELETRVSASSGVLNIRDRNWQDQHGWGRSTYRSEYSHTVKNTYTYKESSSLSGWMIAVIVIVPLVVVIGIVVLRVYVCRACAGRKGGTSYAYQAGPPPYPVSPGTEAGHKS